MARKQIHALPLESLRGYVRGLLLPSTSTTCPQSTHCMRRTAGRTAPIGGLLRTTFIVAPQRGHGASLTSSSPMAG